MVGIAVSHVAIHVGAKLIGGVPPTGGLKVFGIVVLTVITHVAVASTVRFYVVRKRAAWIGSALILLFLGISDLLHGTVDVDFHRLGK